MVDAFIQSTVMGKFEEHLPGVSRLVNSKLLKNGLANAPDHISILVIFILFGVSHKDIKLELPNGILKKSSAVLEALDSNTSETSTTNVLAELIVSMEQIALMYDIFAIGDLASYFSDLPYLKHQTKDLGPLQGVALEKIGKILVDFSITLLKALKLDSEQVNYQDMFEENKEFIINNGSI